MLRIHCIFQKERCMTSWSIFTCTVLSVPRYIVWTNRVKEILEKRQKVIMSHSCSPSERIRFCYMTDDFMNSNLNTQEFMLYTKRSGHRKSRICEANPDGINKLGSFCLPNLLFSGCTFCLPGHKYGCFPSSQAGRGWKRALYQQTSYVPLIRILSEGFTWSCKRR